MTLYSSSNWIENACRSRRLKGEVPVKDGA